MSNPAAAFASAYLVGHRIPNRIVGYNVLCWDCVLVEVRYSTSRYYNHYFRWSLPRPIVAQVVLLIASEGALDFFLFDPDDDVFYYADGRQKQTLTWYDGRDEQRKHEDRYDALTTPIMTRALNRVELIERARLDITANL